MENIVALAKIGENVFSEDPNDFVMNSLYNSFKLILVGTKTVTLAASTNNQSFTQAHGLDFIPLVDAFANQDGADRVFKPNGMDVELWGAKLGMTGDVVFNYVQSDDEDIIFNFDNDGAEIDVHIRYFALEAIF
jgi:hypothetical protein